MPLKIVRRDGSDNWYLRGTLFGKTVCKSTGLTDKHLAEAVRIQTEASILREHVYGPKATKTFSEAAASYIKSGGSERFLDRLIRHMGSALLHGISQADLDAAAIELYPAASNETHNRQCYTPFIAAWNHAVRNGWAETRQWSRPRKPKGTNVVRLVKRRAGTFPVEYEHAARFVAAMSPAPAMLMTALFYTGMRPIEAFALTRDEVNVVGRWITLTKTKTGEPRGIPIHEFLVRLFSSLLSRKDDLPQVFRTPRGAPYEAVEGGGGGLKTAINGARRRSGINDVSPYTGRHTVSTALVVAGIHPHIKDQILGHAADDMSRHYTNVPQQPLIEAINKLPVPGTWRELPWVDDPIKWTSKLAEGTGKRTDLEKICRPTGAAGT